MAEETALPEAAEAARDVGETYAPIKCLSSHRSSTCSEAEEKEDDSRGETFAQTLKETNIDKFARLFETFE